MQRVSLNGSPPDFRVQDSRVCKYVMDNVVVANKQQCMASGASASRCDAEQWVAVPQLALLQ